MNYNKAVIAGNLTRDPETRTLPSGQGVTSFGVATNRVWVNQNGERQEAAEFHNVVAFGKLADICSRYLVKGRLVLIEGRLQTRSWQDQDGKKRYRTEIVADNMQMGPRAGFASQPEEETARRTAPEQATPSQEEIPVIEAEEPIKESPSEDNKSESSESEEIKEENKQEVNLKNIPF